MSLSPTDKRVQAIGPWRTNAEMVEAVARVHYRAGTTLLDTTHNIGNFWKIWKPEPHLFMAHDLDPAMAPDGAADVRDLPHGDRSWHTVVIDLPYQYSGTPSTERTERYGVEGHTGGNRNTPAATDALLLDGLTEGFRVADSDVWFKCQDQVVGGKLRMQTFPAQERAMAHGFRLEDFALLNVGRDQSTKRVQRHLDHNFSTLLIFRRTRRR